MSAKDSQFIERALVHPWMFWVFFWKWPRILRQVCGEYDLVAKDRDAAKAAHEQAVAANEKVRKWIHVTHQLDATADLRAIWTAGKRLSILLVFFVVTNAFGQAPPYLRQYFTTNAHVLSSGAGVLTNNGVGTPGTLGWLSLSSLASASSVIWTNDGTEVMIQVDTNRVRHGAMRTVFGSNDNNRVTITNGSVTAIGFGQDQGAAPTDSSGNRVTAKEGSFAGADFYFATNCYVENIEGAFGGGWFQQSVNCYCKALEGAYTAISSIRSTNCFVDASSAFTFGSFGGTLGCRDCKVTGAPSSLGIGYLENANNAFVRAQSGGLSMANLFGVTNADVHAKWGISVVSGFNARDITVTATTGAGMALGDFTSSSNSALTSVRGIAVGKFSGITNSVSATDGLAFGPVASNERNLAQGSSSVAAFAFGRDVASTNNWTFGIHYTNTVPLSLAVGANGTTQFRAASNSVVIRTETAPTVGQILTATDTSGTVGWSNAPSGGVVLALTTNQTLSAWVASQAYQLLVRQYDTNNVLTNATVQWPDGTFGVFTTTSNNPTWAAIDSYFLTYTNASKTITQALVLRNTFGYITNNPALAVTP